MIAFPLPQSAHRPDVEIAAQLRAAGFVRAQVDGAVVRLDEDGAEARVRAGQDVLVIVDRITAAEDNRSRLADAVATAFSEGEGVALALNNGDRRRFSEHPACSACGCAAPVLTPTLFSFNNPRGACPTCNGFGAVLEYDESLIVPDPRRSLADGALDPWTKPRYEGRRRLLRETARGRGIDLDAAWEDIAERDRQFLLHNKGGRYLGIFPFLERLEDKRYKQYIRVFLRQYQLAKTCPGCSGARLKLINNFLCGVQVASLAEAVVWIERSGLNREQALEFLKKAAPGSPLVAGVSTRMLEATYGVNFFLSLMKKDMNYAQADAKTLGVELRTAATAESRFEEAVQAGLAEKDMSAVIEPLRRQR